MNEIIAVGYSPDPTPVVVWNDDAPLVCRPMDFERLVRLFFERPVYQRLFLAFTLGLFISCSVKMAGAQSSVTGITQETQIASH